jgi:hypothetical protein
MENKQIVNKFITILSYVRDQIESSNGEILEGFVTLEDINELMEVVDCNVREH